MYLEKNISDKIYWHKYIDFYENLLPKTLNCIVEIGVFNGDSIRYWRNKYPLSNIYGIDIIEAKPTWPNDEKIKYFQINQGNILKYKESLKSINKKIDLIIDDGSHDPLHQKITLIESLDFLKENSIYILEDIHTSHPNHPVYKNKVIEFNKNLSFFDKKEKNILMSLQCLLFIDYIKTNNLDFEKSASTINFKNSLFTKKEMSDLYKKVKKINIYKRTVLPNYCYSCNKTDFDFINLKCSCGTELYSECDSMSVLINF